MTLTLVLLATMLVIVSCLLYLLMRTHSASQRMMSKMIDMTNQQNGVSQREISQVAQSAISAMTEATTKLQADQLKWTETMVLGREDQQQTSDEQARNLETDHEPIPGVETLDGLPDNMREAIQREEAETRRLQLISQMPQQDYESTYDPFQQQPPLPEMNGHLTSTQVTSEWLAE